jgi:hypothetical protein
VPAPVAKFVDAALLTAAVLAVAAFVTIASQVVSGERRLGDVQSWITCGGPLAAAALLLCSLRLSPGQRANIFLACASSALAIYSVEIFIDVKARSLYGGRKPVMSLFEDSTNKPRDAAALKKEWNIDIDTRTAIEAMADLRKKFGNDAVPIITPANHLLRQQPDGTVKSSITIGGREVVPLGAVSNKATLLCNENGSWIDYRSDQHGFNNPSAIWDSDRLEIAAVGDSFTQGYCVPPQQNFVALLRQRYRAALNLGMAGDGPLLMLATLREYLPRLRPQLVLWCYFEGNDLTDLQIERRSAVLTQYLAGQFVQRDLQSQPDVDAALMQEVSRLNQLEYTRRQARMRGSPFGRLVEIAKLSAVRTRLGLIESEQDEAAAADLRGANLAAFGQVLTEAKRETESWHGRLVFVYLPDWPRFTGSTSPAAEQRDRVLTVVGNLGIPIIDAASALERSGDPLAFFPFRRPGHYNAAGHQAVSRAILAGLSQLH